MKSRLKCRNDGFAPHGTAEEALAIFQTYLEKFMTDTLAPVDERDKHALRITFVTGAICMIRTQLDIHLDREAGKRFIELLCRSEKKETVQLGLGFGEECEGVCGV